MENIDLGHKQVLFKITFIHGQSISAFELITLWNHPVSTKQSTSDSSNRPLIDPILLVYYLYTRIHNLADLQVFTPLTKYGVDDTFAKRPQKSICRCSDSIVSFYRTGSDVSKRVRLPGKPVHSRPAAVLYEGYSNSFGELSIDIDKWIERGSVYLFLIK